MKYFRWKFEQRDKALVWLWIWLLISFFHWYSWPCYPTSSMEHSCFKRVGLLQWPFSFCLFCRAQKGFLWTQCIKRRKNTDFGAGNLFRDVALPQGFLLARKIYACCDVHNTRVSPYFTNLNSLFDKGVLAKQDCRMEKILFCFIFHWTIATIFFEENRYHGSLPLKSH